MSSPHDPLEPLMERWRAATPLQPAPLANEVWHRICTHEREASRAGILTRIETAFSRPAFAVAFLAASLLLGLFLAEIRLSTVHARQTVELEQSYLRLLDPMGLQATSEATPTPTSHTR